LAIDEGEYPLIALDFIYSFQNETDLFVSDQAVSALVCRLLDVKEDDTVFDLGSGYGSFLTYVSMLFRGLSRLEKSDLLGQEINPDAAETSRMLLSMCGSTFVIDTSNAIEKKPPFSYNKAFVFPPVGRKADESMLNRLPEFKGLLNPRTSVEWIFILRALQGLEDGGRVVALIVDSPLFRTQDQAVREYLLRKGFVEGIISLPENAISYGQGIKSSFVILSKSQNRSFKVVDAGKALEGLPVKGLRSQEAAVDIFNAYSDSPNVVPENGVQSADLSLSASSLLAMGIYDGIENAKPLHEIAEVIRGTSMTVTSFKDNLATRSTPFRLLTSSNIEGGTIDYDNLACIVDPTKFSRYFAHKGDLIVTTKSTTVKMAVVLEEPKSPLIVTGGMLIIRPKANMADSTFLKMFLESKRGTVVLDSVQKGTKIRTIFYEDFIRMKVPCPKIEIQRRLASEYNEILLDYKQQISAALEAKKRLDSFYEKATFENE
jgi:type I restriction enzyme M protein